jgi:hypothetical protein
MGFGSYFLYFPCLITSTTLVDELTSVLVIPPELQGNSYPNNLNYIIQKQLATIYGMRHEGEERPRANDIRLHERYFNVPKDSSDGYPLSACKDKEMRDIIGFICPIFDPSQKEKVHISRFNQVYLSLHAKVKVNWARLLYRIVHKCSEALGEVSKPSYLSSIFFHYYNFFHALTGSKQQRYNEALTWVWGQVEQDAPLRSYSPKVPPPGSNGAPSQPNLLRGPTSSPRQAWTRDAGDGSGRLGGSRQTTSEPRTKLDSPGYLTYSKDHKLDVEYNPAGRSSGWGQKRKSPSQSWSLEHSSKTPRLALGTGKVYMQKERGGLSQSGLPSTDLYARQGQTIEMPTTQVPAMKKCP